MIERTCHGGKHFFAKLADIKRGWANSCSKSCAAHTRENRLGRNGYRGVNVAKFFNAHLCSNKDLDRNK